jgi:hypothetical protein
MRHRSLPSATMLAFSSALCLAVGCAEPALIGERRDGGPADDARASYVRTDECGNGVDDDGNDRIDDGCPCGGGETQRCFAGPLASREVGACSDGIQTCRLEGAEWGDWGDSPCVGGSLPATERCDGMDHDCDGARDEGCPCTAGEEIACGIELLSAPCTGGTQRCSAGGTWSSCEGAIVPTADVCEDAIDNDCDGAIDDGCGCRPEPERCRDGIDNDCDGTIDEPACTPDHLVDGGPSDAALPPPEGCETTEVPDFRDRIVWHTAIPGTVGRAVNIGGHSAARLAGIGDTLVAIDLAATFTTPYRFAGTTTIEAGLGYLAFADGSEAAWHAWPGPAAVFDTADDRLAVAGSFVGTLDIGLGAWTSDPTLYSTPVGPRPAADLYLASAAVPTGTVAGGRHFPVVGVPPDPEPGSFLPVMQPVTSGVDAMGNVYVGARFVSAVDLDGTRYESGTTTTTGTELATFLASFTETGALRWLDPVLHATFRELEVDPTGRYLAVISDRESPTTPSRNIVTLELRDSATGSTLFRHDSSISGGLALLAVHVDADANVVVMGQTNDGPLSLGALSVAGGQDYVASFDRTGALRWSHELMASSWPAYQSLRYAVSSNGTEVAMLLGTHVVTGAVPRRIRIGSCVRDLPWRVYPREPATGRTVPVGPSSSWEAHDLFLAVLDAATGEHRWSRVIDARDSTASLAMHPSGDVVVALHNGGGAVLTVVDYGEGPSPNDSHAFRLRGR